MRAGNRDCTRQTVFFLCKVIQYSRTTSDHCNFIELVARLDSDLAARDGKEHAFYAGFNAIDKLKHVTIAHEGGRAVACGAMKEYDRQSMEIKRMYTLPEFRGRGLAAGILKELESWAKELSYAKCILETGQRQPEAIGLYRKNGYRIIPNYGQYAGVQNSVCFEKLLTIEPGKRKPA